MFLGGVSSLDHFDAGTSVYLIQVFEKKWTREPSSASAAQTYVTSKYHYLYNPLLGVDVVQMGTLSHTHTQMHRQAVI
jgi:hypothetical protein